MASRKKAAKTVKKTTPKKAAKKATPKKAMKKAPAKKAATKKKTPVKKTATSKKKAVATAGKRVKPAKKAAVPRKKAPRKATTNSSSEPKRKKPIKEKAVENIVEANLPPVEEKSPAVQAAPPVIAASNIKSMQKAAVRNYDNHHLRLSSLRKGGIKPSGKKPLW